MRPDELRTVPSFRPAVRRRWLDLVWAILALVNLAAIIIWPSWDTAPFHLISAGFAVLYWFRVWPVTPLLWGLGVVAITSLTGLGIDVLHDEVRIEEMSEIPLLASMFVVTVWHANRRVTADHKWQLIGEKNARLLNAQRRFLQDASHHLRTPVTIALTHAELLARDLSERQELRDVEVVVTEMGRLRRLSDRLLVIAAAEDPDFLRAEPVPLHGFVLDTERRWEPTAKRDWRLGRLEAVTVQADTERLSLAMDALLENAVRHTIPDDVIEISVIRGETGSSRIIVSDTGSGIPAGELAYVFDRFHTGSNNADGQRGTGLGLSLVRAIAEAHGGSVQVRSTLGQGSEFELILPGFRRA